VNLITTVSNSFTILKVLPGALESFAHLSSIISIVEVIAVMASVIALIQISDQIIDMCKFYIHETSDVPSELRTILVEPSMLKAVLESLQFLKPATTQIRPCGSSSRQEIAALKSANAR
jgi:hypothetical protein